MIAVTSARDLAVVREGVSLGVVQYVLKPFTFATLRDRLVRYAEFHAAVGEASGQDEADRALATLRAPGPAALPKGLSAPTLERVTRTLRDSAEGLTAAGVAESVGISRITARRYLEHLVEAGRAARAPQYGQVGGRSCSTGGSRADRAGRQPFGRITARPFTFPACSRSYARGASSREYVSVCTDTAPARARSRTSTNSPREPQ